MSVLVFLVFYFNSRDTIHTYIIMGKFMALYYIINITASSNTSLPNKSFKKYNELCIM